jgi:hypothetical protein
MYKMSTTMHKSAPSKIVTGLKNNSSAANGSQDQKGNQNEPIRGNMSATHNIAVIDIERENRLSKVISLYDQKILCKWRSLLLA